MSVFLLFGFAAVAAISLFWCLVGLERAGNSSTTVLVVLWVLVLDAALYSDPNEVPVGLFHPGVGADPDPTDEILESAISFRLVDLFIPIAIGARLYARGLPERIRIASLYLLAFLAWLACAGVIGSINGNASGLIAFELKAILYLGLFGLVASMSVRSFVDGRGLLWLLYGAAAFATTLIFMDGFGYVVRLDIPLLPVPRFGDLGADAAGIFVSLGLIALALALVRETGRLRLLAAAGPLLLSPAASGQRAVILTLIVSLTTFAVVAFATRRPLRATPTEFALLGAVVISLAAVPAVGSLALGSSDARLPFEQEVQETFTSRGKQQSAQSRLNQWKKARELIEERPVTGWGLGKTYEHYDAGHLEFFETNYTHNVATDLLMRTGAIGLVLFVLAIVLSFVDGLRAWRRQTDDLAAVLGLASAAIIAGLLARGMVESLFEKYRLAALLGVVLGIVGSVAVRPVRARFEERVKPDMEKTWSSGTSFAR